MEKLIEKLKTHLKNIDNKKAINKLFIILMISVLLLILLKGFTTENKEDKQADSLVIKDKNHEYTNIAEIEDYSILLEKRLKAILEKFQGVDKVHVMITLEDSSEKIPAVDKTKLVETTEETDSEGGERKVKREDEKTELLNLSDDIVVLKEIQPNVKGVIVIAEEIENGIIVEDIFEAVKTVLGVSANKVQVFTGK